MTTTTIATKADTTRFLGLPKNKTGLFAADTIHEVKPSRHHLITVPALSPQFRNNGSTNVLLASSEQNHHQIQQYHSSKNEIQQYYPLDSNNAAAVDSSNDSRSTLNGIRNGFRPSTVRHPKLRVTTAAAQRNNNHYEKRDSSAKQPFVQSHASVKLRSEIDHIKSKLKRHEDLNNTLRLQNSLDLDGASHSALSYSTSCRLSSASTTLTADRIHQRFSSAITNGTANTFVSIPAPSDASNQIRQHHLVIAQPTPINELTSNQQDMTDYRPSYAYQVPQQSNVGSESIFPSNVPLLTPIKTRSAKNDRRKNDPQKILCPFYVMYLTNLAMQQRDSKNNNNENERTPLITTSTTLRKVPVNSRTSTANPRRQSTRKQANSPISMNTYSTIDDDDSTTITTPFANNKRVSAKTNSNDNESSHVLRDILRTSSWNQVQV